jgi:hypothetical protein
VPPNACEENNQMSFVGFFGRRIEVVCFHLRFREKAVEDVVRELSEGKQLPFAD